MKRHGKILLSWMIFLMVTLAVPVRADAAVKISRKSLTLLKGQSAALEITGTDKKVKWSSGKKAVASVSKKGKVTARKSGTAVVKAKIGKKTLKCRVTVQAPKFAQDSVTLDKGQKLKLQLKGTDQKITWSSSDKGIVSVNKKGILTAKAGGTARITATVLGRAFVCKVTVQGKGTSAGGSSAGGSSSGNLSGGSSAGGNPSGTSGNVSGTGEEPSQVWITASGTKYHRSRDCSNMKNPSLVPLSQAKDSGRSPCSKCF